MKIDDAMSLSGDYSGGRMNDSFYQSILEETATSYAYHRILLDAGGAPCDYVYLDTCADAARFTGLFPPAVTGRRASEVIPDHAFGSPKWIRRFGEVALTGRSSDFDCAPPVTLIPCTLHVYSPQKGYFVILFKEKSLAHASASAAAGSSALVRELAAISGTLRSGSPSEIAGQALAESLLRLGGAKYAAFHRILPDGGFETAAIAGVKADTLLALDQMGIRLAGRQWAWGPGGSSCIPRQGTVVYPDASALAAELLPASFGALIPGLGAGEAVLTGIPGDDNHAAAGFFTLLMPSGQPFCGHDALATLASVAGLHMAHENYQRSIKERDEQLAALADSAAIDAARQKETLFDHSPGAMFLVRVNKENDFRYERVNHAAWPAGTPDLAMGLTPAELFGQERGGTLEEHFARCVREARTLAFEESIELPDGVRVYRTTLMPIMENGRPTRIIGASCDVTSHVSLEHTMREHLRRNDILLDLLDRDHATPDEFLEHVMDQALVLTSSKMGGIFLYDRAEGCLRLQSRRGAWEDDPGTGVSPRSFPIGLAGLWADAVRDMRPVLANRLDLDDPLAPAGRLSGQPRTDNFMCVPVMEIGQVAAVIGVGSRDGEYTRQDALQLGAYMDSAWKTVRRLRADRQLGAERDLLKATLLSIGDGVITTDLDGIIRMINEAAAELTGWTCEEAVGKPLETVLRLVDTQKKEPVSMPVSGLLGTIAPLPDSIVLLMRDESSRPIAMTLSPVHDEKGVTEGAVAAFHDVTQERHRHENITYLSYHDALTGLYNRRFFEEELRRLNTRRNLPITLVMADVNALKLTNDAFGHTTGDRLLRAAADAIKSGCREDDIIARIGGDEFIILLPRTSSEEAATVVSRIKELCDAARVDSVALSISFGWDTKALASDDIQEVFKRAEDRMYRQKLFESPSVRSKSVQTIIKALYEAQPREEMHSRRVALLSEALGQALGLPDHVVKDLHTAGLLYDIGKVAVREGLLDKQDRLSDEERHEIRRHSEIGYRILSSVNELADIADYILLHHERWDGTGYPKGLQGSLTPLPSRIIGLADAYDAMTSERPYRNALSREEALKILKEEAGTKFDPELVRVFTEQVGTEVTASA